MDQFSVQMKMSVFEHRRIGNMHTVIRPEPQPFAWQNIFSHENNSTGDKNNIFIEGETGSGKTTVCHKIAWDWSWRRNELTDLDKFKYVIYVNACDYRDTETFADYIKRTYASDNDRLTPTDIYNYIDKAGKFLVILDSLDGIRPIPSSMYDQLDDEADRRWTAIITGNVGNMNLLKDAGHMELYLQDLTQSDTKRLVQAQYGDKYDCDIGGVCQEGLRVLSNPLHLHVWNHFCRSNSYSDVKNQQSILDSLYATLMERCKKHGNGIEMTDERDLHKVQELAFTCLVKERRYFSDCLELNEVTLGLLSFSHIQDFTKRNRGYFFTHSIIQEYLAAQYIVRKSADDNMLIADLIEKIPDLYMDHNTKHWNLMVFITRLLVANNQNVEKFLSAIFKDWFDAESENVSNGYVGHDMHLFLHCLAECENVNFSKKFISETLFKEDAEIWIENTACTGACLRGLLASIKDEDNVVDVDVYITNHQLAREHTDLMKEILRLVTGFSVGFNHASQLSSLLGTEGVYRGPGLLDLYICRLENINISGLQGSVKDKLHHSSLQVSDMTLETAQQLCQLYGNDIETLKVNDLIYDEDYKKKRQTKHSGNPKLKELHITYTHRQYVPLLLYQQWSTSLEVLILDDILFGTSDWVELLNLLPQCSSLQDIDCTNLELRAADQQTESDQQRESDDSSAPEGSGQIPTNATDTKTTSQLNMKNIALGCCDWSLTRILLDNTTVTQSLLISAPRPELTKEQLMALLEVLQNMPDRIPELELAGFKCKELPRHKDGKDVTLTVEVLTISKCSPVNTNWLLHHVRPVYDLHISGVTITNPRQLESMMNALSSFESTPKPWLENIVVDKHFHRAKQLKERISAPTLSITECKPDVSLWFLQQYRLNDLLVVEDMECAMEELVKLIKELKTQHKLKELVFYNIKCQEVATTAVDESECELSLKELQFGKCDVILSSWLIDHLDPKSDLRIFDTTYEESEWELVSRGLKNRKTVPKLALENTSVQFSDVKKSWPTINLSYLVLNKCGDDISNHVLTRCYKSLRHLVVQEHSCTETSAEQLMSLLELCPMLRGLEVYDNKNANILSRMLKSPKVKEFKALGLEWYDEESSDLVLRLFTSALPLHTMWLYNSCSNDSDRTVTDGKTCKFLVTKCGNARRIQTGGVDADVLIAKLAALSDEARKKLQWESVEVCDDNSDRLDGGWEDHLIALGINVPDDKQEFNVL